MMEPPRCKWSSCVIDVDVCCRSQTIQLVLVSTRNTLVSKRRGLAAYKMNMGFDLGELVNGSIAFSAFQTGEMDQF